MTREPTDFLYPFIEGDEVDAGALLADLAASAEAKAAESRRCCDETLQAINASLSEVAEDIAARLRAGRVLYTFGNGGSSTDAATLASLFASPPGGVPLAARCLTSDAAVLTALGNDIGFDLVFSRQLIAHSSAGDVALGVSTSGDSENLLRAFGEGKRRGLLTVAFAGYQGGRCATSNDVDHCFGVRSDSVHRVQESQAELGFELWARVQRALGERAGSPAGRRR